MYNLWHAKEQRSLNQCVHRGGVKDNIECFLWWDTDSQVQLQVLRLHQPPGDETSAPSAAAQWINSQVSLMAAELERSRPVWTAACSPTSICPDCPDWQPASSSWGELSSWAPDCRLITRQPVTTCLSEWPATPRSTHPCTPPHPPWMEPGIGNLNNLIYSPPPL